MLPYFTTINTHGSWMFTLSPGQHELVGEGRAHDNHVMSVMSVIHINEPDAHI